LFDDKAKIYHKKVAAERAILTAKRQAEIRAEEWMCMDDDVRLMDIPSCNEEGWTHAKILELINFPPEVERAMEEHSVLRYDPRWGAVQAKFSCPSVSKFAFQIQLVLLQLVYATPLEFESAWFQPLSL
jgi:hypothetical protein